MLTFDTYIIFTSGTTGTPKAVYVPHQAVVSNVVCIANRMRVTEQDTIFLSSPSGFDASVTQMFITFYAGGTLLVVSPQVKLSPQLLCEALIVHSVTLIQGLSLHCTLNTSQLLLLLLQD